MKNFFKNFFNDPTVQGVIDTAALICILTGICYALHLLYKY